ncbi:MAG: cellulase family glycosylhydrolase [Deltaproteobacteria bacterium]|jgi:endoglycosylceramidase|nr:cellulase family glycosylhydrolase [Deltaproteobacteria bacterium]MBW2537055.1 cellulase family glycosylhydrolase [Deltaproteobacteria bacterium]
MRGFPSAPHRFVALAVLASAGCGQADEPVSPAPPCQQAVERGSPLGVRCGHLIDEQGRVVLLRGVNARVEGLFDVTFDDGRVGLEEIPPFAASDAVEMRSFGFDSLRLPINWSGLEPSEHGGIDESYLAAVKRVIDDAAAAGHLVIVDFHQDAYSKEIGEDGAPLWAIDPPPVELLEGPLENLEERRTSAQVLAAFETFFGASDRGAGLRQRFVAMAGHVARSLADHPAVLGFEIYNEPVTDDAGVARLNEAAYPALREAAPDKLYLFEPPATRNFTDQATLAPEPLGPLTGYAPHVYTFAFSDDPSGALRDKEQLRRSNENARLEADSWGAPLVITEWGFSPYEQAFESYLRWQSELQQEIQASTFYWLWKERSQGSWGCFDFDEVGRSWTAREAVRSALAVIRPARIAGWPEAFSYDRDQGTFRLTFWSLPEVMAPHWIAVAPALVGERRATCDGRSIPWTEVDEGVGELACGDHDGALHELRVELVPAR